MLSRNVSDLALLATTHGRRVRTEKVSGDLANMERLRTPAMAAKRGNRKKCSDCESYERLGASKKHFAGLPVRQARCCAQRTAVNTGN